MNYILLLGMPGGGELIFIVLVIIMLFGSKKIPEIARGLGKGMREIKNATNEIQQEIKEGVRQVNNAKDFANVEKQVKDIIKEDKEQKQEEQKENVKPEAKKETEEDSESLIIKPVENPNTIQRNNPYSTNQNNTSEEA